MTAKVPLAELAGRRERFRARMDRDKPDWELAAIVGRVNQYYFTGTLQDGLLLAPREGQATFFQTRPHRALTAAYCAGVQRRIFVSPETRPRSTPPAS